MPLTLADCQGQAFARNADFSIEQNQRLSNAKSRIL